MRKSSGSFSKSVFDLGKAGEGVEQRAIVTRLDVLSAETKKLEGIYEQKVESLEELKRSVLQKAFDGEL